MSGLLRFLLSRLKSRGALRLEVCGYCARRRQNKEVGT
jgi:hypothetical protein